MELVERLTALSERAGARVNGVFTLDFSARTTVANAGLMGLGRTRRIVLGDTLYGNYTPEEIEAILAHELGHHVHHDIGRGIAVNALFTLSGLWFASVVLRWGVQAFGFRGPGDVAAFPLLALVALLFGIATLPLGNAYSRWRERLADRFALQITGNPRAFGTAMLKLADQNLTEAEPEPWVVWLLYSHPTIGERVAMADAFQGYETTRHLSDEIQRIGGEWSRNLSAVSHRNRNEGEDEQDHYQQGKDLPGRVEVGDLIQEQRSTPAEEEQQGSP
jgi:STE24 endopeptidase